MAREREKEIKFLNEERKKAKSIKRKRKLKEDCTRIFKNPINDWNKNFWNEEQEKYKELLRKLEHSKPAAVESNPVEDIDIFEKTTVEHQEVLDSFAPNIRLKDGLTVKQTVGELGAR